MSAPVLLFGATGGIGAALARRLHRAGHPLYLSARDSGKLTALAQELGAPSALADVTDEKAVAEVVAEAAAAGNGALAGLAFCVGSIVLKPLKAAAATDYEAAFRLNALAPALAIKAAAKPLAETQGAVVLFSTVAVAQGFPNHAVISAAKGAVEGLTRALAAELAPKVRVNCVAPSLTRTPLAEPITKTAAMADGIAALHAIPRLGEADDIAAAAEFLLTDASGWITGQVLAVDGGRTRVRTKG